MHEAQKPVESRLDRLGRIGPTALMVAYRRSLTDIKYADDIFKLLSKKAKSLDPSLLRRDLAPQIEARYKIVNRYLRTSGIKQILEIAAGLSPRGLEITEDPSLHYVEFDLPSMIGTKNRAVADLMDAEVVPFRPNLHFQSGDALEINDLERATASFSPHEPLAVVNEGLLRYLTLDERANLAWNIHNILSKFGGVWITPDISLKRVFENENSRDAAHVKKVSRMTGADIEGNRFESVEAAKDFFEVIGFDVEIHSWLEVVGELTSPGVVDITHQEVIDMNSLPVLFVMHPRNGGLPI